MDNLIPVSISNLRKNIATVVREVSQDEGKGVVVISRSQAKAVVIGLPTYNTLHRAYTDYLLGKEAEKIHQTDKFVSVDLDSYCQKKFVSKGK